jgi:hypothetical protein
MDENLDQTRFLPDDLELGFNPNERLTIVKFQQITRAISTNGGEVLIKEKVRKYTISMFWC